MPRTKVIFYQEPEGTAAVLDWMDGIPERAQDKCRVALERLAELGHELRRPEADYLRDGIYELRVGLQRVNYRMLYFFHGKAAAVLSQGLVKEKRVPPKEIDEAVRRKKKFEADPTRFTYRE